MSTVRVEAELSPDELLKAVGQLAGLELEQFVTKVIALQAQRKAPCVSRTEAELLLRINRGLPAVAHSRYHELLAKRQLASLTSDEHQELLRLTDEVEKLEAVRMESLAELARLRQKPLRALMTELGIEPPAYV